MSNFVVIGTGFAYQLAFLITDDVQFFLYIFVYSLPTILPRYRAVFTAASIIMLLLRVSESVEPSTQLLMEMLPFMIKHTT